MLKIGVDDLWILKLKRWPGTLSIFLISQVPSHEYLFLIVLFPSRLVAIAYAIPNIII